MALSIPTYTRAPLSVTDIVDSEHLVGPPAVQASKGHGPDAVRGGFLGFVAHEMRNPLATALWSAELLTRLAAEERAGARGEKLTGMCLRALQRLRLLVEDHFLAERLDVSGIPLRMESLSLREAVEGVLAKGGGDVATDVEADLVVQADRALLDRALDGLFAVAARGQAPVSLSAKARNGLAEIVVRGAPPAPDALASPQKGTASDPTGHALALYMAQRVARALSGALDVADGAYVLRVPLGSADRHEPAPA